MIRGKPAEAAKRTSGSKRGVSDEKAKGNTGKKDGKCAANVPPTPPGTATKTALPTSTAVTPAKPQRKKDSVNIKLDTAKRTSTKSKMGVALSSSSQAQEQKKCDEKSEKRPSCCRVEETAVSRTAPDETLVEDLERTENVGNLFPLPVLSRHQPKKMPRPPEHPKEAKLREQIPRHPSIDDRGSTATPERRPDAPVVEDLEKVGCVAPLLPLPVIMSQRPSSQGGRGKKENDSGRVLHRAESAGPIGWKSNSNSNNNSCVSSNNSRRRSSGYRRSASFEAPFNNSDDDEEEEEEEEEEDEDEDDLENSSDGYDEEEGEEEEEEEEEEDDDECTDGDDRDVKPRSRRVRRVLEQITVKVSREGDRNVKVMFITEATKFKTFVKDIMRRFSYTRVGDFDMYCIDAAGDHVDIDVPKDFSNLVKNFLQSLRQEPSKTDGITPLTASITTIPGSTSPDGTWRFSTRETLLGSAPPFPTAPFSFVPQVSPDVDRSSSTVLRLYVRDSYRARQKEERMPLHYSTVQVDASGQVSLQHQPSPTPSVLLRMQQPLLSPDVLPLDPGGVGSVDLLMRDCSIPSQFNHNGSSLAQTINFRDDEEVQWSRMCLLGKGCFGAVYEGITSEGKIMAVKVQEIPLDEGAEEVKLIQREINLMRSLKHKNIVAYYGCQTKILPNGSRQLEIFLEHCHGGSLTHLRRKFERAKERFSISLVRTYTRQILEGLNYLHSMNVVHRDLKGDNVLISALGEAKLADFGCSKRIGTATLQQDSSAGGGVGYQTMVGTPLFMAPEVLNGTDDTSKNNTSNNNSSNSSKADIDADKESNSHGYGKPADIWAVGCLVLELLGRQPWAVKSNANAFQIMYHISKSQGMPTGVPTKCPKGLHSFFMRCFERNPARRATAQELLHHEWITCPDNRLEEVLSESEG